MGCLALEPDHGHLGRGDAQMVLEDCRAHREGAGSDFEDAGAEIDISGPVGFREKADGHPRRDAALAVPGGRHHAHVSDEGEPRRLEIGTKRHVVDVARRILIGEANRIGAPVREYRAILQPFVS